MSHLRLDDRVALVTGGATGIGAAAAVALAEAGAAVAIGYRASAHAAAAVADVRARIRLVSSRPLVTVDFDVRSVAAAAPAVGEVVEALGRLDIVVNSAGTNVPMPAVQVDEATWDLIHDTNLKGTFFVNQAAAQVMISQGRAAGRDSYSIVNVASQMGLVGAPRRAAYCASKAGVVNLTRALAIEWAQHGIRVNAVAPTFVRTPLAEPMYEDEAFRAEVLAKMPMGEIGEPEDVAGGILYLCSPAARLVTGHTLLVDGGWTAW